MALTAGVQLGPYEVVAPIGAGAMGEVYRAKDGRLGREVAIKVLPPALASDPDRLRRFEQEARAAGMLNHPNILAIYDIGTHEGSPYLVSELLHGETLRDRLGGGAGIGLRKSLDYALQTAKGLAAAHDKGITHRDLKPENIFITKDGRVKILDFGLAKLTRPEILSSEGSEASTLGGQTQPGAVLGTVGYMSPEQVRGQPVDHRSDIFTFGAILYEMICGKRAFRGASAVETMSAILKEEPPDLSATNQTVPPALERSVRHCLEKNPEERFQSARDVAFDLESVAASIGPSTVLMATPVSGAAAIPTAVTAAPSRKRLTAAALIGLAAAALYTAGLVFFMNSRAGSGLPPTFHLLTFRRGTINSARFAPDGQTIVYGASWDGKPVELFSTRPESPDSRQLNLADTEILAISPSGEMAISLKRHSFGPFMNSGTLARATLAGGASREILENVQQADWGPDNNSFAIVRNVAGRNRLEFPAGKVLYESPGWIGNPRVSPKGDAVAFLDHQVIGDDGGEVAVVDLAGKKRTLSSGWASANGLAWQPARNEIWFTATRVGGFRGLYAVSLAGKERVLERAPGALTLHDIARDGRVLVSHEDSRQGIIGLAPGETKERDLSWLDYSGVRDISLDGKMILFSETGEGGGKSYSLFIRKTDGSPAVQIGDGAAGALSPDGKWALSIVYHTSNPEIMIFPTGPGEPRRIESSGMNYHAVAVWFPDGKRIAFVGNEPGHGIRIYVQDIAGGKPRAITPEGTITPRPLISPDGKSVLSGGQDEQFFLFPVEGGEPRVLRGISGHVTPSRWSADGRFLYYYTRAEMPTKLFRLDTTTGKAELAHEFVPADPAGIGSISPIVVTPDAKAYAYTYDRILSTLYLVDGLK